MDPQNAREAIQPVSVPPKPLGMVFNETLPSVKVDGVPVTQVM
jgi:hypothetical protein